MCDGVLKMSEHGTCGACKNHIHKIKAPYCMKCGKQIKDESGFYCTDCKVRGHNFDEGRILFLYDEAMKQSMYRFKYNGRYEYASFYGEQLCEAYSDYLKHINPDVLIPIPIHKKRLNIRGYNQAGLLAKEVGRRLKIPVSDSILIRTDATVKQKNLNARERQNNLKKAFKTTQNDVKLSTAVLIDDIYTTGATIDAAAACLKKAGFEKIYYLCVAGGRNT